MASGLHVHDPLRMNHQHADIQSHINVRSIYIYIYITREMFIKCAVDIHDPQRMNHLDFFCGLLYQDKLHSFYLVTYWVSYICYTP